MIRRQLPMKKMCLALALAIGLPVAALAQPGQTPQRDPVVWQRLYQLACDRSMPTRGGNTKPLGFYLGSSDNVEFRSGYKDIDPKTQADFAYDLYQYVLAEGGGWQNFLQNTRDQQQPQGLLSDSKLTGILAGSQLGQPDGNASNKAHVSYEKEQAFAQAWWAANSDAYRSSIMPPKYWWSNDAVLDADDLWLHYEEQNFRGGADQTVWMDGELEQVFNKT